MILRFSIQKHYDYNVFVLKTSNRSMTRQAERREFTRNAILVAATRLINSRGFHVCSIAAIARETPYSTGAIQHHFKSKNELLYCVITEHIFTMRTPTIDALIMNESIEKRCRMVIDAMWSYYGNTNYPLVWEVILGSKKNTELRREIDVFFRAAETKAETQIHQTFSDIPFTKEQAVELRRHLSAQLRGISLLKFAHDINDDSANQLEYLAKLIALKITDDMKKSGSDLA